MRDLQQVPNIGGQTTTYPDGSIVDNSTGVTGTAVTEKLYGDLIQAVYKLRRQLNITPNNLPDNEDNGYQLLTALIAYGLPIWSPLSDNIDLSKNKFVVYNNGIYYHKTTTNTNNNPSVDTANWFQVLYWNGTKIVYSEESRLATIEGNISTNASNISSNTSNISTNATNIASNTSAINGIGMKLRYAGYVNEAGTTITKETGDLTCTIADNSTEGKRIISHNFGGANYRVIANTIYSAASEVQEKISVIDRGVNSFTIWTGDDASANNAPFEFMLVEI